MSASPNRQAIIVGFFITIALAILASGVLMIGRLNDTFTRRIVVSAVFPEVSGLKKGDNIWFSGLKVGTVRELSFLPDSRVQVKLGIDEDATAYIHEDVLVKIGSDGLIGNRIVVLYGGTTTAPPLEEGDVLTVGETVSTEEMLTMLQENNANLLAITTDIKSITGKIAAGEGSVGKVLQDEALYANMNKTVESLSAAADNAQRATGSLSTFSAKLNSKGSLPNQLVTDTTTYAQLQATVGDLQQTGERASALVDGLARGANNPATPIGVLMHDQPAGTDLKKTLDNMNEASELLAEDLEALQHNFLLRRYFKKKAEEEAEKKAEARREREQAEAKREDEAEATASR